MSAYGVSSADIPRGSEGDDIMQRAMREAGFGKKSRMTRTATDHSSLAQVPVALPVARVLPTDVGIKADDNPDLTGVNPVHGIRAAAVVGSTGQSPVRSPGGSRRSFYAVYRGKTPGVYRQWSVASLHATGAKGNSYKGFDTLAEAVESMRAAGFDMSDEGEVLPARPGK